MLRSNKIKLVLHGFQPHLIESGFDGKLSHAKFDFKRFHFNVSQNGSKEMIGLGASGFGG